MKENILITSVYYEPGDIRVVRDIITSYGEDDLGPINTLGKPQYVSFSIRLEGQSTGDMSKYWKDEKLLVEQIVLDIMGGELRLIGSNDI